MATEKRLIRAVDMKTAFREWFENEDFRTINQMIDDVPTVDAVEVVRCKDCKYSKWDDTIYQKTIEGETNDTTLYCCFYRWNHNEWNKGDHFCSYGERRTDGT